MTMELTNYSDKSNERHAISYFTLLQFKISAICICNY